VTSIDAGLAAVEGHRLAMVSKQGCRRRPIQTIVRSDGRMREIIANTSAAPPRWGGHIAEAATERHRRAGDRGQISAPVRMPLRCSKP